MYAATVSVLTRQLTSTNDSNGAKIVDALVTLVVFCLFLSRSLTPPTRRSTHVAGLLCDFAGPMSQCLT